MGRTLPPALPRQVISLLSILLVVFLVAFPSSSSLMATLVLLGGGLFLLGPRLGQSSTEVQMQPMEDAIRTQLAKQGSQPKPSLQNPAGASQSAAKPKARTDSSPDNEYATAASATGPGTGSVAKEVAHPHQSRSANGSGGQTSRGEPKTIGQPTPAAVDKAASVPKNEPQESRSPQAKSTTGSTPPLAGGAAVLARLR